MLFRRLLALTLLLHLFPLASYNQEFIGLSSDNYAGIGSARLNPSLLNLQKEYFSFRILSSGVWVQNNFSYYPNEEVNIFGIISGADSLPVYNQRWIRYRYYDNSNLKTFSLVADVGGPSFMLSTKRGTFGFQTAIRSSLSGYNIPFEIPVFLTEGNGYVPFYGIRYDNPTFNSGTMTWAEAGFSWSTKLVQNFDRRWDIGVSAKFIYGLSAAYLTFEHFDYVVIDGNTIQVFDGDGKAGIAAPIDYDNNAFLPDLSAIAGLGFGFDAGITLTKLRNHRLYANVQRICEISYNDYFWRLGFSLLDIGKANFKNHAETHSLNDVQLYWDRVDTIEFVSAHQLISDMNTIISGDSTTSYTGDHFSMSLPSAFSIQYDIHPYHDFYFGAVWIHPLRLSEIYVRRPAEITLLPRIEKQHIGFSLPISLYEYTLFRMGAAFRYRNLTIGTERVGVWLGFADISGLDVYFSVKFSLSKGKCVKNPDIGACFNDDRFHLKRKKIQ